MGWGWGDPRRGCLVVPRGAQAFTLVVAEAPRWVLAVPDAGTSSASSPPAPRFSQSTCWAIYHRDHLCV